MTNRLLSEVIFPGFQNSWLEQNHDGAVLEIAETRLAFTTDSYVVEPRFFPGGDIGSLAVNGTVNDLAMCGARPKFLSCSFILEEGYAMEELTRVVQSMRAAADRAAVSIVTGDTKVVDRGSGDGLFVNTTGIGVIEHRLKISPQSIQPGDAILLSGDLGRHGITILAEREGLEFESSIESDCAPLWDVVDALLEANIEVRCLRDLTRGGLATVLKEVADDSTFQLRVEEETIPVSNEVRGACEMLGLDPFFVANEGTMIAIVPGDQVAAALAAMRAIPEAANSVEIGQVEEETNQRVILRSILGTDRVLDRLPGEQLPRIC
jgi:hydrogenase expression/formation protein HypE